MSRGCVVIFIILLLLVGGGMFFLSNNAAEVPQETIEQDVSLEGDGDA